MYKLMTWIWMHLIQICLAIEPKAPVGTQLRYPYRNVTSPTATPSSKDEAESSTTSTQRIVVTTKYVTTNLHTTIWPEITVSGPITSFWHGPTTNDQTTVAPSENLDSTARTSPALPTIFASSQASLTLLIITPTVITSLSNEQSPSVLPAMGSSEETDTMLSSSSSPSNILENTLSAHFSTSALILAEQIDMLSGTEVAKGSTSTTFTSPGTVPTPTVAATNGLGHSGFPSAVSVASAASATSRIHNYSQQESITAQSTSPLSLTGSQYSFSFTGTQSIANQATSTTTRAAKSLLTDSVTLSSADATTETGLPSGAPAEILPDATHVAQSPNLAILYVGFEFPLNYAFIVKNRRAALQIFELLPRTLLKNHFERATVVKLLPYHAEEAHSFVKTLAMVACPEALAGKLLLEIQVPNSALYQQDDELSRNLAALIDPGISVRESSSTGCQGFDCQPTTRAAKAGGGGGVNKAATVGMIIGGASLSGAIGVAIFCAIRRKNKRRRRALNDPTSNRGQAWRYYNRIESTRPSMRQFDGRNISRPITSLNSLGIHGPG